MKDKYRYSTGQLFNFAQNSYLERTSRPIYAIVFLLPFIIFYEIGTIFINTDVLDQTQVRVVAFVWLQNLLEYLGTASKLAWVAPPLVVVVILAALQLVSRKRWYFSLGDIWPMAIECILLAVPLIVLSLFLSSPARPQISTGPLVPSPTKIQSEVISRFAICDLRFSIVNRLSSIIRRPTRHEARLSAVASTLRSKATAEKAEATLVRRSFSEGGSHEERDGVKGNSLLADIVTGIGAGIYEELIFRLILISFLMLLFQDALRLNHKSSIILSVLVSAALFSAHHHIVFVSGQLAASIPFRWTEFGFRTIAGVYFAVLFAIRGFGITAGTHAFYDIIATIINAVFFNQ